MNKELRDALATQPQGTLIWDTGSAAVKGLCAKVLAGGKASFYFYYRTRQGQQRKPKIGGFGEITVAEARARAKELSRRVAAGEDPRGDWKRKKDELSVADLYEAALENHWKTGAVSPKWAKQVEQQWDNHLVHAFGAVKAGDLSPREIKAWLARYEDEPYAGNRSLEVLSKVYRYAQEEGLVPLGVNPCSFVRSLPERKRKRYATPEELRAIGAILEREAATRPAVVAYTYLLMFSGTRPSVIQRATWGQLSEMQIEGQAWGTLTVHGKTSGKTGEEDVIVLPPPAMAVLAKLPRDRETDTITGVHQPQKFWDSVRKEAGCPDLWMRDLRRTFATVGLSEGEKLDHIAEVLNHRSTQTTKIYARLYDTAKFKAAGAIAARMAGLVNPPGLVTALPTPPKAPGAS